MDIGELIWQRGWAEANAGNVSIRLPDSLSGDIQEILNIKNKNYIWLLVSSSGSRYREFRKLGFSNFNLIGIDKDEFSSEKTDTQIIFPDEREPTSEWITHKAVQQWLINNREDETVILHAHSTDWIIISNSIDYEESKPELIKEIRDGLPELNIYFPKGITLLPFAPPGSEELAEITLRGLVQSNIVIWEKHGILITAKDINCAFDYLEIISKAATVYLGNKIKK